MNDLNIPFSQMNATSAHILFKIKMLSIIQNNITAVCLYNNI